LEWLSVFQEMTYVLDLPVDYGLPDFLHKDSPGGTKNWDTESHIKKKRIKKVERLVENFDRCGEGTREAALLAALVEEHPGLSAPQPQKKDRQERNKKGKERQSDGRRARSNTTVDELSPHSSKGQTRRAALSSSDDSEEEEEPRRRNRATTVATRGARKEPNPFSDEQEDDEDENPFGDASPKGRSTRSSQKAKASPPPPQEANPFAEDLCDDLEDFAVVDSAHNHYKAGGTPHHTRDDNPFSF